ncbi:hypothetical protein BDF19DRAFT_494429 [Syncephalis fuscata]|nr:hypothetical protein BDF19DRAFT_494429 [Syncephalis fuscata]
MNLGYKLFLAATITASILVFNIDDTVKATASEGKGSSVKPKYVPLPNGPIGYDPETQTFYGQKLNEPDALGRFHLKLKYHLASQHPNVHAAEGLLGQRKVKIYCGNTNDFVDPSTQNQDNSILFYNNCIKTSFNTIEYKWVRDIVGCPLTYFPVHQGHFCYAVPKILNSFKINQKFEMDDSHTMLDVSLHQIIKDLVKELVMGVDYLAKIGFYSDFRDNNIKVARFKAFGRRNFVLAVRFVNPAALRLIKAYDDTYLIPAKQCLLNSIPKILAI